MSQGGIKIHGACNNDECRSTRPNTVIDCLGTNTDPVPCGQTYTYTYRHNFRNYSMRYSRAKQGKLINKSLTFLRGHFHISPVTWMYRAFLQNHMVSFWAVHGRQQSEINEEDPVVQREFGNFIYTQYYASTDLIKSQHTFTNCYAFSVNPTAKMWWVLVGGFYANAESVTQTQRVCRRDLNVPPDRNTILRWMKNSNTTRSLLKNKPPEREIQAIPQEMLQNSMRSFRERLEKCITSEERSGRCNFFCIRFCNIFIKFQAY